MLISSYQSQYQFKPNLLPMKAVIFEFIFSLGARKKKRAILVNMAPLFLRAPRGKNLNLTRYR